MWFSSRLGQPPCTPCCRLALSPAATRAEGSFAVSACSEPGPGSAALASAPLRLVRRPGWHWFGWYWFGWCWLGYGCRLGTGVLVQHGLGHSAPGRDWYAVLPGPGADGRGVPTWWPPLTALATPRARVYRACPACHGDELRRLCRRPSACSVDRSISYVRPSTAKRTVSAAWEPSMSSMSWTVVVRANRCLRVAVVVLLQCGRAARDRSGRWSGAGYAMGSQRLPPA